MNQKKTEINPALSAHDTVVNAAVQSEQPNFTVVNPTVQNYSVDIPAGTVLAEKYVVESPLSTNTGEANLYLCTYRGKDYVAKVYRRQNGAKKDIQLALESVNSPYVAKIYSTGVWNGAPFEIIPFYKYGSLEGKTFSLKQLKENIIPALNSGLNVLHRKKIIHKDLKPSNIMLCDDQTNVAIIDFGISSIREGGNTVVVTKTGMTPEYSAPETFRNLFLEESDYYSLGITIYELFTGHTPYSGVSKDLIEQYIAVQRIPFPEGFPQDLEKLITGLTYNDITNRKDKNNPNRRWTYDEVERWCKGKDVAIPGGQLTSEAAQAERIPPFTFQYKKYTNVAELAEALGSDWKNGKRRLYRSLLAQHFKPVNQEIASHCMDAEDAVRLDNTREDIEFFCVLYKMYPQMKSFHWIDYHFNSMMELGEEILSGLKDLKSETLTMMDTFMQNRLFSQREQIVSFNDRGRSKQIEAIESKYLIAKKAKDTRTQYEQMYLIGYLYSGSITLTTSSGQFTSVQALTGSVKSCLNDSKRMDELASDLMYVEKGKKRVYPQPYFSAWLIALGKSDALTDLK